MNRTQHLLVCLAEECAEVQKEISKALRFGLDDKWKSDIDTAEKIALECFDILAVIEMLKDEKAIPDLPAGDLIQKKKDRVLKYMDYAAGRGTLTDEVHEDG